MGRKKGSKNKVKKVQVKVTVPAPVSENDIYHATIKIFGKFYTATGTTVAEALSNLKPDEGTHGMSIITITKGDKSQEKIFSRLSTTRLFARSAMMREVGLKNTIQRFSL